MKIRFWIFFALSFFAQNSFSENVNYSGSSSAAFNVSIKVLPTFKVNDSIIVKLLHIRDNIYLSTKFTSVVDSNIYSEGFVISQSNNGKNIIGKIYLSTNKTFLVEF